MKTARRIAPRLKEGVREKGSNGLPPVVRAWARMQAEREGVSFSFWIEQRVMDEYERTHTRTRWNFYRMPREDR